MSELCAMSAGDSQQVAATRAAIADTVERFDTAADISSVMSLLDGAADGGWTEADMWSARRVCAAVSLVAQGRGFAARPGASLAEMWDAAVLAALRRELSATVIAGRVSAEIAAAVLACQEMLTARAPSGRWAPANAVADLALRSAMTRQRRQVPASWCWHNDVTVMLEAVCGPLEEWTALTSSCGQWAWLPVALPAAPGFLPEPGHGEFLAALKRSVPVGSVFLAPAPFVARLNQYDPAAVALPLPGVRMTGGRLEVWAARDVDEVTARVCDSPARVFGALEIVQSIWDEGPDSGLSDVREATLAAVAVLAPAGLTR